MSVTNATEHMKPIPQAHSATRSLLRCAKRGVSVMIVATPAWKRLWFAQVPSCCDLTRAHMKYTSFSGLKGWHRCVLVSSCICGCGG